jgi:hypothetical protein
MNGLASDSFITTADLAGPEGETETLELAQVDEEMHTSHRDPLGIPTFEELAACEDTLGHIPDLMAHNPDDVSDSEAEGDEDKDEDELEELVGEPDSEGSSQVQQEPAVATRRTTRHNAGVKRLDQSYEWNLMNLSLGAAIRNFGDKAREACKSELKQLFEEKKAL